MGHDEVYQQLSAYLDGEVSGEERAVIEKHLQECGECAATLRDFQAVSALVRGSEMARATPVTPMFAKRVQQNVDYLNRRGAERLGWALSAIAACLAVVGSLQLMRSSDVTVAAAPAAWERAAVQPSSASSDDTTASSSNNNDLAMAEWMVADLSEGSQTHE